MALGEGGLAEPATADSGPAGGLPAERFCPGVPSGTQAPSDDAPSASSA